VASIYTDIRAQLTDASERITQLRGSL